MHRSFWPRETGGALEVSMRLRLNALFASVFLLVFLFSTGPISAQQIGKYIAIGAGSEADHAMTDINAASDAAQKLALIDKFAAGPVQGDIALVAAELYVNYYLSQKQYDKVFEYGDKVFPIDHGNFETVLKLDRCGA